MLGCGDWLNFNNVHRYLRLCHGLDVDYGLHLTIINTDQLQSIQGPLEVYIEANFYWVSVLLLKYAPVVNPAPTHKTFQLSEYVELITKMSAWTSALIKSQANNEIMSVDNTAWHNYMHVLYSCLMSHWFISVYQDTLFLVLLLLECRKWTKTLLPVFSLKRTSFNHLSP